MRPVTFTICGKGNLFAYLELGTYSFLAKTDVQEQSCTASGQFMNHNSYMIHSEKLGEVSYLCYSSKFAWNGPRILLVTALSVVCGIFIADSQEIKIVHR